MDGFEPLFCQRRPGAFWFAAATNVNQKRKYLPLLGRFALSSLEGSGC